MRALLVLCSVLACGRAGLVRVPKIYNALISSDENLSPSHAIPVVEPVLRTTALGVAFPPIIVPPYGSQGAREKEPQLKEKPELSINYHGTLYPVAVDPYMQYSYTSGLLYPTLPLYQQPMLQQQQLHELDKKPISNIGNVANLKRNPDIPDVPPPALPTTKQ